MSKEINKGKLRGRAFYAWLNTPSQGNVEHKIAPHWGLTLVLEDVDGKPIKNKEGVSQLKLAKEYNMKIKDANDKIPGKHVTVNRKTLKRDGSESEAPKVVTALRKPFDFDSNGLIGNDSIVNVTFNLNEYLDSDLKEKKNSGYLRGVQVIDLVSFDGDGFEDEEGGYVGEPEKSSNSDDGEFDEDVPFETEEDNFKD